MSGGSASSLSSIPGPRSRSSAARAFDFSATYADRPAFSSEPQRTVGYAQPIQLYRLHVMASRNNTIITLTDPKGSVVPKGAVSGGIMGFKKVGRSGYEAAYQAATRIFGRIKEIEHAHNVAVGGPMKLELCLNGFGQGREAVYRALLTAEGDVARGMIQRVTDTTRIMIGGTRPRKPRIL